MPTRPSSDWAPFAGAGPWLLATLVAGCMGSGEREPAPTVPPVVELELGAESAQPPPRASGLPEGVSCPEGSDPFLVPLDRSVAPGGAWRVLAVSESPLGGARVVDDRGRELQARTVLGQAPFARLYEGRAPWRVGTARLTLLPPRLSRGAAPVLACAQVEVSPSGIASFRRGPPTGIWKATRSWDEGWERVYSAWVAWLFRWWPGQPQGWRPLQKVLRNPDRNLLYDSLGLGEDSGLAADGSRRRVSRVIVWADCGDTPYQLRAYFAWKLGLPFRYRRCDRGSGLRGPRCPLERDHRYGAFDGLPDPVRRFNAFLREGLAWQVHSGTTRTLPEDEASDFYPIRMSPETIRPGTIFVDVAGHVLVMTQWDPSGLFAVDGHPDFSVTRRRFSETHFRYFRGTRTGGFKAFRPLRIVNGALVPLRNQAVSPSYSVEQYRFDTGRDFHQAMARLLAGRRPG